MSKTGLAISTYFCEGTPKDRLSIFKRSMESLLATGYPGKIYLVDDGSTRTEHLEGIDKRVTVIRKEHGGIARTKNTCIRLLLEDGVDVGFLADDDVFYLDFAWHIAYSDAVRDTGMDHLSFYHNNKPCDLVYYNGYPLRRTPDVNGCFFTFTGRLIERIGYIKVLPCDYGHEHSNFSFRADRLFGQGGFFDLVDAKRYIDLVPESLSVKSVVDVNEESLAVNAKVAILSEFTYEQCVE
jgi:glycosyltransferase involved in cell wall biosynthesis